MLVVENVLTTNHISFSDDDLTSEGIGHNKALYISVRCNEKLLPRVLIDNGSALNICSWNALVKLELSDVRLRTSATIIRGFDGARREPMGEVDLVLEIGPVQFQTVFQIKDFSSVYNVLLGRLWIHTFGVVPSSLYQKVKFIVNDQLITVSAEDDCIMIINSTLKEENGRKTLVLPSCS